MLGWGVNLVSTIIGFGMSSIFIVFICARMMCGRIRRESYSNSRAVALDVELWSEVEQAEHSIHGLEPQVVAAIPSIKYHRESFHSKEDTQCSICLGEYEDKEILRVMPACLHSYHRCCIDSWLQKHSTCPVCRCSLNVMLEPRATSPSASVRQVHSADFSDENSNAWLLPTRQHTGSRDSNQVARETMSVVVAVPHIELGSGTL